MPIAAVDCALAQLRRRRPAGCDAASAGQAGQVLHILRQFGHLSPRPARARAAPRPGPPRRQPSAEAAPGLLSVRSRAPALRPCREPGLRHRACRWRCANWLAATLGRRLGQLAAVGVEIGALRLDDRRASLSVIESIVDGFAADSTTPLRSLWMLPSTKASGLSRYIASTSRSSEMPAGRTPRCATSDKRVARADPVRIVDQRGAGGAPTGGGPRRGVGGGAAPARSAVRRRRAARRQRRRRRRGRRRQRATAGAGVRSAPPSPDGLAYGRQAGAGRGGGRMPGGSISSV